ncbi:hypothetical protein BKA63DRAFT_607291 [Paraphoma chrysanthemicola]|nr:hypothetical protein BKA63DRAFT_607291 [Paraphoma chrysanthemicola]
MSLPNDSRDQRDVTQPQMSAVQEYRQLNAAGIFTPSTWTSQFPTVTRPELTQFRTPTPPPASKAMYAASRAYTASLAPLQLPYSSGSSPPPSSAALYASSRGSTASPAPFLSPYSSGSSSPHMVYSQPAPPIQQQTSIYSQFQGAHIARTSLQPPSLASPMPSYITPNPTPRSHLISTSSISERIQSLLAPILVGFQPNALVLLSTHLANQIAHLSTRGRLGPSGLLSTDNIFMTIGNEGVTRYMALAVQAHGEVRLLLRGTGQDVSIGDLVWDVDGGEGQRIGGEEGPTGGRGWSKEAGVLGVGTGRLEWLRQGFHHSAVNEYNRVREEMERGGRR